MFAVSFPEKWISEFNGSTLDMYVGFSPEKFWTGFDPRRRHEEKHLRTMVLGCFFHACIPERGGYAHAAVERMERLCGLFTVHSEKVLFLSMVSCYNKKRYDP